MTLINFSQRGIDYHAEVLLGRDLQLDEILQVDRITKSGAVYAVVDTADLEDAIEAELARRKDELRVARDEGRRAAQPSKKRALVEKPLADVVAPAVESQATSEVVGNASPAAPEVDGAGAPQKEHRIMQFNLKGVHAKTGRATFQQDGGKNVVKFGKTAFQDNVVPDAITIDAPFKVPAVPMTKEERKALRQAAPKKTAAEKYAALMARAEKLKATLEL